MAVKRIALVVQEGMKDNLQKLVNDHKTFLSNNYITSTPTDSHEDIGPPAPGRYY